MSPFDSAVFKRERGRNLAGEGRHRIHPPETGKRRNGSIGERRAREYLVRYSLLRFKIRPAESEARFQNETVHDPL